MQFLGKITWSVKSGFLMGRGEWGNGGGGGFGRREVNLS